MSLDGFVADLKTTNAVERCRERISEAAKKLEGQAEILCPEIPWPQCVAWATCCATNTTGLMPLACASTPDKFLAEGLPFGPNIRIEIVARIVDSTLRDMSFLPAGDFRLRRRSTLASRVGRFPITVEHGAGNAGRRWPNAASRSGTPFISGERSQIGLYRFAAVQKNDTGIVTGKLGGETLCVLDHASDAFVKTGHVKGVFSCQHSKLFGREAAVPRDFGKHFFRG